LIASLLAAATIRTLASYGDVVSSMLGEIATGKTATVRIARGV